MLWAFWSPHRTARDKIRPSIKCNIIFSWVPFPTVYRLAVTITFRGTAWRDADYPHSRPKHSRIPNFAILASSSIHSYSHASRLLFFFRLFFSVSQSLSLFLSLSLSATILHSTASVNGARVRVPIDELTFKVGSEF